MQLKCWHIVNDGAMRVPKTTLHQDPSAYSDAGEPDFVKRPGRPKGSHSVLSQWLRPLMLKMQQQGNSCRNAFFGIAADEDDLTLHSFVVSAETAAAYRHELSGDIAGKRVTWLAFKQLWHRVSHSSKNEAPDGN